MNDIRINKLIKIYNEQVSEVYGTDCYYIIEDFTCNHCEIKYSCIYSFDIYNTNGDCLGGK